MYPCLIIHFTSHHCPIVGYAAVWDHFLNMISPIASGVLYLTTVGRQGLALLANTLSLSTRPQTYHSLSHHYHHPLTHPRYQATFEHIVTADNHKSDSPHSYAFLTH